MLYCPRSYRHIQNGPMSAVQIDFYTKPGCHHCHEALDVLKKLQKDFDFEIRSVNISESSEFMARYQYSIPVATLNGRTILKHRADEKLLRQVLNRQMADAESNSP